MTLGKKAFHFFKAKAKLYSVTKQQQKNPNQIICFSL